MEERKEKEIEYYDKQAKEIYLEQFSVTSVKTDFEGFSPLKLASFRFCYKLLKERCPNKKVLDYGCGNGIHTISIAKMGAEKVVAIDLSGRSLEIAREIAKKEGVGGKIEFLKMDCEKMSFPNNSFDVIFDGGTFSSLDLKRALPELARVLKPEGTLIGIETLGHNPLTNLKRKLNKITGKRTGWAEAHIFKMSDLEFARNYFSKIETRFFHLVSWMVFPFLRFPGAVFLLRLAELKDKILLKLPFLKKYSFKIVFVFSLPKK